MVVRWRSLSEEGTKISKTVGAYQNVNFGNAFQDLLRYCCRLEEHIDEVETKNDFRLRNGYLVEFRYEDFVPNPGIT
jgi:hypothetical protein